VCAPVDRAGLPAGLAAGSSPVRVGWAASRVPDYRTAVRGLRHRPIRPPVRVPVSRTCPLPPCRTLRVAGDPQLPDSLCSALRGRRSTSFSRSSPHSVLQRGNRQVPGRRSAAVPREACGTQLTTALCRRTTSADADSVRTAGLLRPSELPARRARSQGRRQLRSGWRPASRGQNGRQISPSEATRSPPGPP
jgi:hypothetical protein